MAIYHSYSDITILQVHVWEAYLCVVPLQVCVFSGVMESAGYQTILDRNFLPFIKKVLPDGHRFWQDNDPKHTSNATKQWMKDNGINHWPTPPESPVSKHLKTLLKIQIIQGLFIVCSDIVLDIV